MPDSEMPYSEFTCVYKIGEDLGLNQPWTNSENCGVCNGLGGCGRYTRCKDPERTLRAFEGIAGERVKTGLERFRARFPQYPERIERPEVEHIDPDYSDLLKLDDGDSKIIRMKPAEHDYEQSNRTIEERFEVGDSGLEDLVEISQIKADEEKRKQELRKLKIERRKRRNGQLVHA